jgi:hypothetical protein
MQVKVKKNVLLGLIKKIQENKSSRGDTLFNNTTGFFGNFGAVKTNDNPIKPSNQMALQLSSEAPPVEDPEYVPVTVEELSLAASRISREVPSKKIEYFYRKLHKLLDAALDHDDKDLFTLNESIDYKNNENLRPAGIRYLDKTFSRAEKNVRRGKPIEGAAQDIIKAIDDYPILDSKTIGFTKKDIIYHLSSFTTIAQPAGSNQDVFIQPPGTLEDITDSPSTASTKIEDPVSKMKYDPTKSLDDLEGPTSQEMKQLDKDILVKLHDVEKEENESLEYINTWTFDDTVPLNKILYALSISLNEISYEVLRSNYIRKFGGQYLSTPEAKFDSGIRQYDQTHPLSRDYAERFLSSAKGIYGFDTKNILRQRNVVKMSDEELEAVLFNAVSGIINRIPEFKQKILAIIEKHYPDATLENTIDFMCELLSRKYRGESLILEKDLIGIVIGGMFKRALIDLPDPVKIPKAPLGHGGNIKSFYKRAKVYPAEFKKYLPDLIMNLLPKFRAGISVKIENNEITFTDRKTNLSVIASADDVMDKIKK